MSNEVKEILKDPAVQASIRRALKDVRAGRVQSLSQVMKELGLGRSLQGGS